MLFFERYFNSVAILLQFEILLNMFAALLNFLRMKLRSYFSLQKGTFNLLPLVLMFYKIFRYKCCFDV